MDRKSAFSNLLLDTNFQLLNSALKKVTIFEILGIENKEVPFTRLLSWLLDPHADHQMGSLPILSFLRYNLKGREIADGVISPVQIEDLNFGDVSVYSEYQIDYTIENGNSERTERRGRLDIYAEYAGASNREEKFPLLLVEAKIGAEQHNDQTHLYQQWAREQSEADPPFRPLLVFLTPEGECGDNVADDFVPMDFTLLNSWLESLQPLLKSDQAGFLINEICSLNARTSRARVDKLEELADKIRLENKESLDVLKGGLELGNGAIEKYEPALVFLGLTYARRGSLGYDDHIATVRQAAEKLFRDDEKWKISGKEASLTIRYIPLQDALNMGFSGSNAINLDCWLDRSKNHLELAVYSIKDNIPATVDEKKLRKSLVQELRQLCRNLEHTSLKVQSGNNFQVARIDLPRDDTTVQSAVEQIQGLLAFAPLLDAWLVNDFAIWKKQNYLI